MSHRMDRPNIGWVELDRSAPGFFGPGVIAAFLKPAPGAAPENSRSWPLLYTVVSGQYILDQAMSSS